MSSNPILGFLSDVFQPFADMVDSLHTSTEEKIELRNKALQVHVGLLQSAMEMERQVIDAQARIIEAEAKGESFLQRCWRPITMLTFLLLIIFDVFGVLTFRLSDQAWDVLNIGLNGFVIGRSLEKVADKMGIKVSDLVGRK